MAIVQIPETAKEKINQLLQTAENAEKLLKLYLSGIAAGMGVEGAKFDMKEMTFVTEDVTAL